MHIFYTPGISNEDYYLNEEESKHCIRVLRLKEQDTIYLIDGVGGFYYARIADANPKKVKVIVYQTIKDYGKRNYQLTIGIAPTKNIDRLEWFLEKATEIGIDRIVPFICHQSERKVIKTERLNKIINAAMKQSKQAYLPTLDEMIDFKSLINSSFDGSKFIAHCFESEKPYLNNSIAKGQAIFILIGPEGDFTMEEVELAKKNNFKEISLGNSRLRTETAGIVAVHTVALINQ